MNKIDVLIRQKGSRTMDKIPQLHRDLLEKESESFREDDVRHVLDMYRTIRPSLRKSGTRMIDDMLEQVEELHEIVEKQRDAHSERNYRLCVGALKYFIKDNDHISDEYHKAGLVDDALVVKCAWLEVKNCGEK